MDELSKDIAKFIIETKEVSTSGIQRKFSIGYNRVSKVLGELTASGMISLDTSNNRYSLLTDKLPAELEATPSEPGQPDDNRSFFERRIYGELCLTPQQNTIHVRRTWHGHDLDAEFDLPLFEEDEEGNIKILVYDLERNVITYKPKPDEKEYYDRENIFYVTRFREPKVYTDKDGKERTRKYDIPAKAGTYPYFPVPLLEKYERGEKIHTLVLTEGYFKAMKGALCGIDVVGLSSITHIKDKDTKAMYGDVLKLIWKCNVENLIVLFDGDCRSILTRNIDTGDDLIIRPKTFFNMAHKCRELLADLKKNMYFATIRSSELRDHPKGLDDLLVVEHKNTAAVADDLTAVSRPGVYFEKIDITYDTRKLYQWFRIGKAEQFYDFHQQAIGDREFKFAGTTYQMEVLDSGEERLKVIIPREAGNYLRVGDSYWEFVQVPNKYEQVEKQLHQRQRGTINEDHGKEIFRHIPKYKAFCNVPNHTGYRPIINNCFNRYYEFEHEPEEGDCSTTLGFVRHIFGEQYEFGLDYLQLLYQRPQQILPILCLVSSENNTGKSTFIKWLKAIFTNNCTIIGNAELSNDFNGLWASKLIIACEESFIDKKPVVERIKALSTGDKISLNLKGKDQVEIDFFGKFVLASNNEDSFIIASKNDIRYWVRKIHTPAVLNVNIEAEMLPEIPAFLHFLNRREMKSPRLSRMWFAPGDIRTEALTRLVEQNQPTVIKKIREKVRQYFFEYPDDELLMPPAMINKEMLDGKYDAYYILKECRAYLDVDNLRDEAGKQRVKRCTYKYKYWSEIDKDFSDRIVKGIGQPVRFLRSDFLTPDEAEMLKAEMQPRKPEPVELDESSKQPELPF